MNCIDNDLGGITYAAPQRIGQPERRHQCMSEVRMLADTLLELGAAARRHWPPGAEMPHELASRIQFGDYVVARVRNGALRALGEVIES